MCEREPVTGDVLHGLGIASSEEDAMSAGQQRLIMPDWMSFDLLRGYNLTIFCPLRLAELKDVDTALMEAASRRFMKIIDRNFAVYRMDDIDNTVAEQVMTSVCPQTAFRSSDGHIHGRRHWLTYYELGLTDKDKPNLDKKVTVDDMAKQLRLGPCPWEVVAVVADELFSGDSGSCAFVYTEPADVGGEPVTIFAERHSETHRHDDGPGLLHFVPYRWVSICVCPCPLSMLHATTSSANQLPRKQPKLWFASVD